MPSRCSAPKLSNFDKWHLFLLPRLTPSGCREMRRCFMLFVKACCFFLLASRWCGRVAASSSSCWPRSLKTGWSSVITTGLTKDLTSTTFMRYRQRETEQKSTAGSNNIFPRLWWCSRSEVIRLLPSPRYNQDKSYLWCSQRCKMEFEKLNTTISSKNSLMNRLCAASQKKQLIPNKLVLSNKTRFLQTSSANF